MVQSLFTFHVNAHEFYCLHIPQVQYGYVNLEEIFRDSTNLSVSSLAGLLSAKIAATSICVGGGLVGGLFAPSLFLGAIVGDIAGHFQASDVVDNTTFIVVGAAAVLGASCRAPLTALALMIEITRDTGLLLPLLAAIGTASIVTDYVEGQFSTWLEAKLVELYLKEKVGGHTCEPRCRCRCSVALLIKVVIRQAQKAYFNYCPSSLLPDHVLGRKPCQGRR